MTRTLDYADIQGNVTRAYGRYSFPFARYFFLNIQSAAHGRRFVDAVRRKVTTAAPWRDDKPKVTLNIGFTFLGLYALQVPSRTLQGMPNSFVDGMKDRAFLLGDRDQTKTEEEAKSDAWCAHWDKIWRENRNGDAGKDVHVWMSMNAQLATFGTTDPVPELEEQTQWLRELCAKLDHKVSILATNGPNGDEEYQQASAVFVQNEEGFAVPTPREHFGITDGIGNPVFKGQYPDPEDESEMVIGRGKWMEAEKGWEPLETGEFLLGHPDESQETPPAAMPPDFSKNGTFMVYRKLHENVSTWEAFLDREAEKFARVMDVPEDEARETLLGKIVGRWRDGVPLVKAPTFEDWQLFREERGLNDKDPKARILAERRFLGSSEATNFRYGDDMEGVKCPVGSHLRRVNPRDYLDPLNRPGKANPDGTTQLNKRRRIMRRGLPYGDPLAKGTDDTQQGVAFMVIGTGIFRQFEFVQQQWIQYGLDFNEGNNTCPLLGDHGVHDRHPIPAPAEGGKPPYIVSGLKNFVEARGGDYFFIPSMTCLAMIANGTIDPT